MKKLTSAILALCLFCTSAHCEYIYEDVEYALTNDERERIWNEINFCIQKLYYALDKADREAAQIMDIDIEQATRAAIAGAVAGLSSKNAYGVVIGTCLSTIGQIAGDSYIHFRRSRKHIEDSRYYAFRADELQERLWRNE